MKKTYIKPSMTIKSFDITNAIMSNFGVADAFNGQTSMNKAI